jgi:hypothetical protein
VPSIEPTASEPPRSTDSVRGSILLLGLTVFLSAFLLFQVQPIIARYILPWFGSTPGVWTTSLLFFQVTLLVGYAYAHFIVVRFTWPKQALVHSVLLGVTLLALPITPPEVMKPADADAPSLRILLILAVSVGAPYAVLSTTAPLVQRWFAHLHPGRSPYRLYALSNTGSLLALLTYPFLVEPAFELRTQTVTWSAVYGAFVLLCVGCALQVRRSSGTPADARTLAAASSPRPTLSRMLFWLLLSACGSGMLLAVTNQTSIDVAVVPFLWVLPLGLYLLSFILSFDHERWYLRPLYFVLLPLVTANTVRLLFFGIELGIADQVTGYAAALFVCCMCCHGELSRSRPGAEHLTLFFLIVSLGGAVGGLFVALVAPALFRGFYELPVLLVVCYVLMSAVVLRHVSEGLLLPASGRLRRAASRLAWGVGLLAIPAGALLLLREGTWLDDPSSNELATFRAWRSGLTAHGAALFGGAVLLLELIRRRSTTPARAWYLAPRGLARVGTATCLALGLLTLTGALRWQVAHKERRMVDQARNFYGALAIKERDVGDSDHRISLTHGRINHGSQLVEYRSWPTAYYGPETGVGIAIQHHPHRENGARQFRIGIVGLGVGTLAAYGNATVDIDSPDWETYTTQRNPLTPDYLAFYELNPQVVDWAKAPFSFLTDAEARGAELEVFEGDARITLERQAAEGIRQRFDVLAIDAFSSDAIPIHLITLEAIAAYTDHLQEDGVLAFHVTNRHVDLLPIVQRLADEIGYETVYIENSSSHERRVSSADWVLLTRNERFLSRDAVHEDELPMPPAGPLWTDDFSSLFEVVEIGD